MKSDTSVAFVGYTDGTSVFIREENMAGNLANERLRQYMAAEQAILKGGQSYRIGNRTLTRGDLAEIRKQIDSLIASGATTEDELTRPAARRAVRAILRD